MFRKLVGVIALALLVGSCKSGDGGLTVSTNVVTIIVSPQTITVAPGNTTQLTAVAQDAEGATVTGVVIEWTSNNETVATVSPAGLVSGVAVGTASISAAAGGKSGAATVSVEIPRYSLAVSGGGTGSGSVTSGPAGVNCQITQGSASGTCSALFESGTSVTLTPTPAAGNSFSGWSGACTGLGPCAVTMTTARTVTASFTPAMYTVATSSNPANGGTTAGGGTFTANTMVTVTATPALGFGFQNWTEGGNVVSTSASYQFPLAGNRTLVANFAQQNYTLTVNGTGTGNGTVTAPAAGGQGAINCVVTAGVASGTCAQTYPGGTNVTLTAAGTGGFAFNGWTGACTGTGVCNLAMTEARTVTANFGPDLCAPQPITVPGTLNGNVPTGGCVIGTAPASVYRFTVGAAGAVRFNVVATFPAAVDVSADPPRGNVALTSNAQNTVNADWVLPAGTYLLRVQSDGSAGTFTATSTSQSATSNTAAGCQGGGPIRILVVSGTYSGQSLGTGDCAFASGELLDIYLMYSPLPCTITMTPTGFDAYLALFNANTSQGFDFKNDGGTGVAETWTRSACVSDSGGPIFIGASTNLPGESGAYVLTVTLQTTPSASVRADSAESVLPPTIRPLPQSVRLLPIRK